MGLVVTAHIVVILSDIHYKLLPHDIAAAAMPTVVDVLPHVISVGAYDVVCGVQVTGMDIHHIHVCPE